MLQLRQIVTAAVVGFVCIQGGPLLAQVATPSGASAGQSAPTAEMADMAALRRAVFPLLDLLEPDQPAGRALAADPDMKALTRDIARRTRAAAAACEKRTAALAENPSGSIDAPLCTLEALRWTPAEAVRARTAALRVFSASKDLQALIRERVRPSGMFALHAAGDDEALFLAAWDDAHAHVDRVIRVYGFGERPRFADIDSVIYPLDKGPYPEILRHLVREVGRRDLERLSAWTAPQSLALELMIANRRDDAVFQAALEAKENALTARRMQAIDWQAWRYTVILVPGNSPEIAYEPLNPNAKLRIRRGVESYREGLAPVIVVSGGTLRPIGTEFNEALEMKRHILATYPDVPADAILIDPVARHTTTNVRNTVRLLMRYGGPLDRPALVVGNSVPYIASDRFRRRCLEEMGYAPFEPIERLDFERLSFRPLPVSRHHDASDPMDP
jgi:hypothetical protein